jgi:UDP-N-acetylmuramate--alanine ligase
LMDDFATAFVDAGHVIVTAIYAAREHDTLGVSGQDIVTRMKDARRCDARYIADLDDAAAYLLANVKPGDVVITLSAGDGNRVGDRLLQGLSQKGTNGTGAAGGAR